MRLAIGANKEKVHCYVTEQRNDSIIERYKVEDASSVFRKQHNNNNNIVCLENNKFVISLQSGKFIQPLRRYYSNIPYIAKVQKFSLTFIRGEQLDHRLICLLVVCIIRLILWYLYEAFEQSLINGV